jgi:glutamine cyclotransferase
MAGKSRTKTFSLTVAFLLFLSGSASSEMPVLKRAEEYMANMPVRMIRKIPLPKGYHEGLFFDGEYVWVNNGKAQNTWIIKPDDGSIVSEIKPVSGFTEGITAAGDGTYWVTDWEDKKLYRVKLQEDKMIDKGAISLDPAHPAGVVKSGEKLYVVTWTRGVGTRYHLIEFDGRGQMLRKIQIKRIHEPAHLAWDGRHLWITSWYNQLVYKIDIDTLTVLGSFRSPAPETTGIAWDGEYFWITGSHADLYQVEVERATSR